MDGKELYNLHEAYMDVYEGLGGARDQSNYEEDENERQRNRDEHLRKYKSGELPWQKEKKAKQAQEFLKKHPRKKRTQEEQVDIYDIILSHLLDEGYAETLEAAEAMMVNMSEEWRDSIMEEVLDEERKSLPITKMKEKEDQLKNEIKKRGRGRAKIGIRLDTIQNIRRNISKRGGKEDLSAVFKP